MTFTVRLSRAADAAVAYSIATADGTARAGSDYVARSLTGQTIPAGQTSKEFAVAVNGDTAFERAETFFVDLGAASGATIADGRATGTILGDEAPRMSRPLPPSRKPSAAPGTASSRAPPDEACGDPGCTGERRRPGAFAALLRSYFTLVRMRWQRLFDR